MKNRDQHYGVTVHRIVEKIDAGPIWVSQQIRPDRAQSVFEVTRQLMGLGAELLISSLDRAVDFDFGQSQIDRGSYYGWPTSVDVGCLYKNGGRLL
jgi:methionyl-tRNA formyltransferase